MSDTTSKQEEEIATARDDVFKAVKSAVEESFWYEGGGDYEEVFGEDIKFDASDMSVVIKGRRFVLTLTAAAEGAKKRKVDEDESK